LDRTKKAIINTLIVSLFSLISSILSFVRYPIYISFLGAEMNGLIQVALQFCSYLSLMQAGIGSAYLYRMYEPYANGDSNKVFELYNGLKNDIKSIGMKMIVVLIPGTIFYSLLLSRIQGVDPIITIIIFVLIGLKTILPFVFSTANINLILLQENNYIKEALNSGFLIIGMISEILMMKYLEISIITILSISLGVVLMPSLVLWYITNKNHGKELKRINGIDCSPRKMTRDILIHKISYIIFNGTDIVLLSIFSTLVNVTIYTSYNMLMNMPTVLINKIISGVRASIGLKLGRNDANVYDIFDELVTFSFYISNIVSIVFYICASKFVRLWLGNNFYLNNFTTALFAIILFFNLIMPSFLAARDGKGLYKETRIFTILQAFSNITLSIILVKPFGINGLLLATVISILIFKSYFNIKIVYNNVFSEKLIAYKYMLFSLVNAGICILISELFFNNADESIQNWMHFIKYSAIVSILTITITSITFLIMFPKFKKLIKRIKYIS